MHQDQEDQEATINLSHTDLVTTSMHLLTKRPDSIEEMIPALVEVVRGALHSLAATSMQRPEQSQWGRGSGKVESLNCRRKS